MQNFITINEAVAIIWAQSGNLPNTPRKSQLVREVSRVRENSLTKRNVEDTFSYPDESRTCNIYQSIHSWAKPNGSRIVDPGCRTRSCVVPALTSICRSPQTWTNCNASIPRFYICISIRVRNNFTWTPYFSYQYLLNVSSYLDLIFSDSIYTEPKNKLSPSLNVDLFVQFWILLADSLHFCKIMYCNSVKIAIFEARIILIVEF